MAQQKPRSRTWSAFADLSAELVDLGYVGALLDWDQETMMPADGAGARARLSATLQGVTHRLLTAPRVGKLLGQLEAKVKQQPDRFGVVERAQIRELRREYDQAVKLPERLVRELAEATSHGFQIWQRAYHEDKWAPFEPALARIVDLEREKARHLGYERSPYDALLDLYEPGMTVARLTPIFDELRPALVSLLDAIRQKPEPSEAPVKQPFDVDEQWRLARELLGAIGFDFQGGRLDRSTHPFATKVGHGDARLTDRSDPNDLRVLVFGAAHEGGHGLYEQNLLAELDRTTVGRATSMGVHESQSRLWENFVGRSAPFWRYFLPRAQCMFPEQLANTTVDAFVRAVNVVRPSLIRTEADEVTYNLHVILRFELGRGLIDGTIQVSELPELWKVKMRQYLGLTPPDARSGVLQDPHWAMGLFGYFPTYTLGNVYAAQIWDTMRADLPVDELIAEGRLATILDWLRTRIYQLGSIYRPVELIERVTGKPPSARHLIDYLQRKYGALYGLAARTPEGGGLAA